MQRFLSNTDRKTMGNSGDQGILYVVATPIGNLEDITLRALRILGEVGLIASEDTRHTRKLLSRFDIHTPLTSYYKGKESSRAGEIIASLQQGTDVALVSDAGTPGISDPGTILVRRARAAGIAIVPVPGPSAAATAFSVAGLEGGFLFLGFLPSRAAQRRRALARLASEPRHLVFYEAPHRILKCLADCLAAFGDRTVFIAREMTKRHEEFFAATIAGALEDFSHRPAVKGEFVVIVRGAEEAGPPLTRDLEELLVWCRDQSGLSLSEAARKIARDLGLSRAEVYKKALAVWDNS